MNDKYVDFNHGLEDCENYGKEISEKERAIRNCLLCAENIMVKMLRNIVGKVDTTEYAEYAFMFESWKEEKDNL